MEIETVKALYKRAVAADLDGIDILASLPFAELADYYNGIGPEFLPPSVREKVTQHLALFEPAALIHDVRNEFSDGTREAFHRANREFLANCRKLAAEKYGWWNPRRYIARDVAKILFKFVEAEDFGWPAWLQAKERHEQKVSGNSAGKTKEEK